MNNEGRNGDSAYLDSIYPPDLILLNVNNNDTSPENSSSIPSPDSPLSTPPDSPLRGDTDGDDNEEEKKDEEGLEDAKALIRREEVPLDECFENDTSTKNAIPVNLKDRDSINLTIPTSGLENLKESTDGQEGDKMIRPLLSSSTSTSEPFDEDLKKTKKKIETFTDSESAPDDEKKVDDSSLPIIPKVVRSSKNLNGEEGIITSPIIETATNEIEKRADDGHYEKQHERSVLVNTKSILVQNGNIDGRHEEPPSLTLVDEAKKRLSACGLSDCAKTNSVVSPSSKVISPSKIESKKDNRKTSEDKADAFDRDDGGGVNSDNHANVDVNNNVDEPPSLSPVEEAMKRTSLMILKHNQRDRGGLTVTTPKKPTMPAGTVTSMIATPNSTTNISESNRLAILQRDIMSLKSSLSDMNMKLHKDQMKVQKNTAALDNGVGSNINDNDDKYRVEHAISTEEIPIKINNCNLDNYNDIPSTSGPRTTVSTKLSPPENAPTRQHSETSFEQSAVAVSPDRDIDCEKEFSSDIVEEDDPGVSNTDSKSSLHPNTSHVVSYADDEDEIMTTKCSRPSFSQVKKNAFTEIEVHDAMDPNVTMETTESSLSRDKSNDTRCETTTSYRKMTPKKDLQGSDNSARWLQEELRRRAGVKREINRAIEATGQSHLGDTNLNGYTESVVDKLQLISSAPEMQNSQSTMDEEVAAITANDERNRSMSNESINFDSSLDGEEPPSLSRNDLGKAISRKLEFGDHEEQPHDEMMVQKDGSGGRMGYHGFRPVFEYQNIQHEMKKFASETRAALREQSFTDPSSSAIPVAFSSPLSTNRPVDIDGAYDHPDFEMKTLAKSRAHTENNTEAISINFAAIEEGEVPKMLISMDSFDGIASGDIFLSLLSENTGRSETSVAATWADRVHGAIWRAKRMRRRMIQVPPQTHSSQPLVRGGSQTVASVQQAALMHLKRDEIDDSINLVEGIVFAYYSYFERSLNIREKNPASGTHLGTIDFKPYIGMALHNLGVLNLLKGDYDEALSYFARAVENRKGSLGDVHPTYISSLVRLAVCRYALNEFAEAHAGLEEALACAKRGGSITLEGRLQVAEILNNLGCLAYMSGQPTTASSYYRDSMDIQFKALSDSLYLGNATSGQSISLNISIARANIGFIKLVTKDLSVAITALENALMEQQILLKGIDDTLIATMDHLALSNLLVGSQEKAALMYNRILTLQQNAYGPDDRRCFITIEKMNMVQGKGVQYEGAIEELRKTFSIPPASSAMNSFHGGQKARRSPRKEKSPQSPKNSTKIKKKKVFKALTSMMKKNP